MEMQLLAMEGEMVNIEKKWFMKKYPNQMFLSLLLNVVNQVGRTRIETPEFVLERDGDLLA